MLELSEISQIGFALVEVLHQPVNGVKECQEWIDSSRSAQCCFNGPEIFPAPRLSQACIGSVDHYQIAEHSEKFAHCLLFLSLETFEHSGNRLFITEIASNVIGWNVSRTFPTLPLW